MVRREGPDVRVQPCATRTVLHQGFPGRILLVVAVILFTRPAIQQEPGKAWSWSCGCPVGGFLPEAARAARAVREGQGGVGDPRHLCPATAPEAPREPSPTARRNDPQKACAA